MLPYLFFFNDTATTEIYTLSLHDALPISWRTRARPAQEHQPGAGASPARAPRGRAHAPRPDRAPRATRATRRRRDRKSTRLNSSHLVISYAVFCLKKKKRITNTATTASSR